MKNIRQMLPSVIWDSDRKSLLNILLDLKKLLTKHSYRDLDYYFINLMYKKNAGNLEDYIDRKAILKITQYHKENVGKSSDILNDKILFSEKMQTNDIPTGPFLGKVESNVLIDKDGKRFSFFGKDEINQYINGLLTQNEQIFIKQVDSSGGKGVFRLNEGDCLDLSIFKEDCRYIIEKSLIQNKELAKINPKSINTLRCVTHNNGRTVTIANSILRMGTGDSFVDNASSGGIFVGYDIINNELDKVAYTFFSYGGKSFYKHPNTRITFYKTPLPFSERVIVLVTEAAKLFPDKDIIGWDVAYTPEGPILIEGNTNPHITMTQICLRGLRNSQIYKKLYSSFIN